MAYQEEGTPLVVFGGEQYGAGSSRDWAAKGTALLGVKAVIAESFERIHRSNLVGMGVIPFEFTGGDTRKSLGLKGDETVSIHGLDTIQPLAGGALHHHLRRWVDERDHAQVPDRYGGRDRIHRARRRAALRAAQPRGPFSYAVAAWDADESGCRDRCGGGRCAGEQRRGSGDRARRGRRPRASRDDRGEPDRAHCADGPDAERDGSGRRHREYLLPQRDTAADGRCRYTATKGGSTPPLPPSRASSVRSAFGSMPSLPA
jgi:hypothetical protein